MNMDCLQEEYMFMYIYHVGFMLGLKGNKFIYFPCVC